MRSRRYELVGPREGRVVETDITGPGPGQVVIEIITGGVCASDVPLWANPVGDLPLPLGHELVGRVVSVGAGADLALGAVVGGRVFPAFAEFALGDARDLVLVPPTIDPRVAVPEPMGCVAEALRRTPLRLGARVAVVGLGFMGLLMMQFLRNAGPALLVGIDPRDDARQAGLENGADTVYVAADLPPDAFSDVEAPARQGFDVVIEASGSQAGLDLATRLVRAHGVLSILGYHQGGRQVDMHAWNWKALDVVNGHVRDRDLLRESTRAALQLQAAGRISTEALITHRYSLDSVDAAYTAMTDKPSGFIKALIDLA